MYCTYTADFVSVAQSRGWLPDSAGGLVWFGPHGAHATCYVPFAVGEGKLLLCVEILADLWRWLLGMEALSISYRTANPWKLSRASAYWAHRYVENLANLRYSSQA